MVCHTRTPHTYNMQCNRPHFIAHWHAACLSRLPTHTHTAGPFRYVQQRMYYVHCMMYTETSWVLCLCQFMAIESNNTFCQMSGEIIMTSSMYFIVTKFHDWLFWQITCAVNGCFCMGGGGTIRIHQPGLIHWAVAVNASKIDRNEMMNRLWWFFGNVNWMFAVRRRAGKGKWILVELANYSN